jgi:hypothetical protein
MTSYVNFADFNPNRLVRWNDNGRYGSNLYFVVPLRKTFLDVVAHESCVLGGHLPKEVETVKTRPVAQQKREEHYYPKGDHPCEPNTRNRPQRQVGKHVPKRSHRQKKGVSNRVPEETDLYYFKELTYEDELGQIDHGKYEETGKMVYNCFHTYRTVCDCCDCCYHDMLRAQDDQYDQYEPDDQYEPEYYIPGYNSDPEDPYEPDYQRRYVVDSDVPDDSDDPYDPDDHYEPDDE